MSDDVTLRVMGDRARVIVTGGDAVQLSGWAVSRLQELDARWSRFRPDSEITALNRAGGRLAVVSDDTFSLLEAAVAAWSATGGLFDPTMLDDLVAHGYDRPHQELTPPSGPLRRPVEPGRQPMRRSRCGDILLDQGLNSVLIPAGVEIDPGGIGRGLAADIVATELLARGARGALVDLGGDIRVVGDPPDGGPAWTVTVEDPFQLDLGLFHVGLAEGGLATSSQLRRRWSTAAGDRHHLLDATSGDPSSSPVSTAVVAAGSACWAQVLSKAALLAGFDDGPRLLESQGALGVLFDFDGEVRDVHLLKLTAAA